MHGYAYEFLAIVHAAVVIITLVWLPFGKFFHIFQRPAQLGVSFYKDAGQRGEQAKCARCGQAFASKMHVDDLIEVEQQLGYAYEVSDESVGHYQRICPRCRRLLPAILQDRLWRKELNLSPSPTQVA
jgi:ribosomal protein S27AE